jgi:transcriptional regulator with XRE-family HTH domain
MPVYESHLWQYGGLKFGERVRAGRQLSGMTLAELSRRVNISVGRLSEIENDRCAPDLNQARAIAAMVGQHGDFLPAEIAMPYQITREADLRTRPPREVHLGRLHQSATVPYRNVFWPLADLFVGRHLEPMLGRILPASDAELQFCFHHQVEFVFGLRGTMEFLMKTPDGLKRESLGRGDCICIQAQFPHCFRSLDATAAESLHVLASGSTAIESAFDSLSSRPVVYLDDDSRGDLSRLVGERLRVLRDSQGWSAEQVARLVGLAERQLQQIENGARPVRLDTLLALARVYGKPLHDFVTVNHDAGPYYCLRRSAEIASIPARRRRTPVERPHSPISKTCQPLVSGFPTRGMHPYFIRLLNVDIETLTLHEHHGHEFIYVLDGQLELTTYSGKTQVKEILHTGDSCYLDSSVPHLARGETRNPYSSTSAEVIDVFWCPLGESYLFDEA